MATIQWHIESRKINDLKSYSKNPRRLTKDQAKQLTASLKKFGLIDIPIINTDNTIIGGHQRLRILTDMGMDEVQVHVPSRPLTEDDMAELNIRLNKNTGEWDWDILANEWEQEDLQEWGFSEDEFCASEDEPKKKGKPKIVLEFDHADELNDFVVDFEKCNLPTSYKMKIKI